MMMDGRRWKQKKAKIISPAPSGVDIIQGSIFKKQEPISYPAKVVSVHQIITLFPKTQKSISTLPDVICWC